MLAWLCHTTFPLDTTSRNCFALTLGFTGGEKLVLRRLGAEQAAPGSEGTCPTPGSSSVTSLPILPTSLTARPESNTRCFVTNAQKLTFSEMYF